MVGRYAMDEENGIAITLEFEVHGAAPFSHRAVAMSCQIAGEKAG
jgi:hypothetical protein